MKVLSVIGARPQFIKLAPLSRILRKNHQEYIVHTGQHYDYNMSQSFFDELEIATPDKNLGVGSDSQSAQTAKMLVGLENEMIETRPDVVLVFGDTNSTLAGALAASKLNIPVAHVEAGLRSFNREMPEEINRILTDRISDYLFCPTPTAMDHLKREGLLDRSFLVGDVMVDAMNYFYEVARKKVDPLGRFQLIPQKYLLTTIHRQANTDNRQNLQNIIDAFIESKETTLFPVHPRTKKYLQEYDLITKIEKSDNLILTDPLNYLETLILEKNARKILTDSGGMQKEAYIWGVPCITLRDETEWTETVEEGWNVLTGASQKKILSAISEYNPKKERSFSYGNGKASEKIVRILEKD